MGTGETGTPTKAAKLSTAQDQQASYPEWAAAFQAYYNSGGQPPHSYFPPAVASGPQPPPYMWGPQPMIPPYGTPAHSPYGVMYPHRGVYGHPAMTPGSHVYDQFGLLSATAASEGTATLAEAAAYKLIDIVKDRSPIQGSKGSVGNVGLQGSKGSDAGKGNSRSANGVFSQSSGESGSEGSSEGSEEDNPQNILQKRSSEQMKMDGRDDCCVQDYWSGSTRGSQGGLRTSESTSSVIVPTTLGAPLAGPPGRDGIPPELWLQDEREVKRQRRKQSNRESARRSRLRKQAECEELGTKVDTLTVENMALRTELTRLSEECEKLTAENTFLLGQLQKAQEDDADAEVLLNKGVESKGELAPLPCYGHGRILRMSCESPQIHGTRAHDEDSSDSTGKGSSPLELGTCPEAVTAV